MPENALANAFALSVATKLIKPVAVAAVVVAAA